eukprot:CAMPEP_0171306166 /NCGR_PEP_ID=MMETSP0816-20121228/16130_1 /TAXON_ID=420281 /ORGANISM="Proboscia inermis, Strain CCAP1064/1" /LENGTH=74 /DNA_ID=CAMNT_0011787571 /DNA_START=1 /DNA_END=222 /DNA_ORIENTATION=+
MMAVKKGSRCYACVVACGNDLDAVRSVLGPVYKEEFGAKGTLFVTPGTELEKQAAKESAEEAEAAKGNVSDEAR